MSDFDLSAVLKAASEEVDKSGGKTDYKYKLLYPNTGVTTVKFLFNPQSGLFKRLFYRHNLGGEPPKKVACMRTWGDNNCPVCKVVKEIEATYERDYYTFRSLGRGISFVHLINTNYKLSGEDIKPGDVILLMYPWTIFKDLGIIINQAKTEEEAKQIISMNSGYAIDINRTHDNNYSAKINPFARIKTIDYHRNGEEVDLEKVKKEDEAFVSLLNDLDPLTEQGLPAEPTEQLLTQIKEAADQLAKDYLQKPSNEQKPVIENKPASYVDEEKITASDVPTFSQESKPETANSGKIECFGKYGTIDKNTCFMCPDETKCQNESEGQ